MTGNGCKINLVKYSINLSLFLGVTIYSFSNRITKYIFVMENKIIFLRYKIYKLSSKTLKIGLVEYILKI